MILLAAKLPRQSDGSLGATLELLRALWAVNHEMESTSRRMRKLLGVTGLERMVIRFVGRYPGLSAGDLARLLCVHPSSLSLLLKRLDRRDLLKRTTDPDDERRVLLRLTRRGLGLDVPRTGTVEAAVSVALQVIAPRDVERTIAVLAELRETLLREGRRPANGGRKRGSRSHLVA